MPKCLSEESGDSEKTGSLAVPLRGSMQCPVISDPRGRKHRFADIIT